MAHPAKTFLVAVQTAAALIQNGAVAAFNSVHICPDTSTVLQRLRAQGNRFPSCCLVDEGGSWHPHNKKIETRRFSATIAVVNLRDPQGDWASRYVLDLCDLFLIGDGTNPGQRKNFGTGTPVVSLPDSSPAPVSDPGHTEIIYKTLFFDYTLQRSS